jgi:uncharacterized coiled-coil protein SlyX
MSKLEDVDHEIVAFTNAIKQKEQRETVISREAKDPEVNTEILKKSITIGVSVQIEKNVKKFRPILSMISRPELTANFTQFYDSVNTVMSASNDFKQMVEDLCSLTNNWEKRFGDYIKMLLKKFKNKDMNATRQLLKDIKMDMKHIMNGIKDILKTQRKQKEKIGKIPNSKYLDYISQNFFCLISKNTQNFKDLFQNYYDEIESLENQLLKVGNVYRGELNVVQALKGSELSTLTHIGNIDQSIKEIEKRITLYEGQIEQLNKDGIEIQNTLDRFKRSINQLYEDFNKEREEKEASISEQIDLIETEKIELSRRMGEQKPTTLHLFFLVDNSVSMTIHIKKLNPLLKT